MNNGKVKTILILGAGFLGNRINDLLRDDIYKIILAKDRIFNFEIAGRVIDKYKPDIVINCIGATGKSNVDDCEDDVDRTLFLNSYLPLILAEICIRAKVKLVHISSGCIYHGNKEGKVNRPGMIGEITFIQGEAKAIPEVRTPDFFDLFYSRAKIYSEQALLPLCEDKNILILRIRIPLDCIPHPKNVLTKLIKYKKIIDVPNSVTYIPDFVKALDFLLSKDAKGIYNIVNRGVCRYPELMEVYSKRVLNFKYEIIPYKKLGLVRTNLLLSVSKLESLLLGLEGFRIREIKDVYAECINHYVTEQSSGKKEGS